MTSCSDFLNLYVEKKTLAKAVACTMIFNTASAMTNLSLNSQNRLFSCSEIGLLIGFLVFHLRKISFVKPEACAIIFSTASSVIVYFDTRGQNGWLAHCKCKNAVSESPVWPQVSNHIFLYKFMRTRVGSMFTGIENAP